MKSESLSILKEKAPERGILLDFFGAPQLSTYTDKDNMLYYKAKAMDIIYPTTTASSSEAFPYFNFGKYMFVRTCETRKFYSDVHSQPAQPPNLGESSLEEVNSITQCYDPFISFLGIGLFVLIFALTIFGIVRAYQKKLHYD